MQDEQNVREVLEGARCLKCDGRILAYTDGPACGDCNRSPAQAYLDKHEPEFRAFAALKAKEQQP